MKAEKSSLYFYRGEFIAVYLESDDKNGTVILANILYLLPRVGMNHRAVKLFVHKAFRELWYVATNIHQKGENYPTSCFHLTVPKLRKVFVAPGAHVNF